MSSKQLCAFIKHRDMLQYEKFYDNHPATYLPYVFFNHTMMSILPSLYADESTLVEKNRVIWLQERKLGLKILEIFINATLNVNIKLNEDKFNESVNLIKVTKPITRDVVYPLLVPEYYMSQEDVRQYRTALASFFPGEIVKKSEDLIPCLKFYEEYYQILSGTQLWAPGIWHVLHFTSYVIDQQPGNNENKEYLASLTGIFDMLLPCIVCRYHYRSQLAYPDEEFSRPFPVTLPHLALEYAKQQNMFEFFSILHNYCKPVTDKKELLSVEYYKRLYKKFYDSTY